MIKILYEDNHLLVVEKKVGILSQSDGSNKEDMLTILKNYLKEKYQKPGNVYLGLVHRLDKDVGGVMVFAKTSKAAKRLSEQIRKHEVKKKYLAVIKGIVKNNGYYEDYLEKRDFKSYIASKETGKLAKLTYNVISFKEDKTLVKINLETGRYHQIRAQFSYHHHPLLGDMKYGKKGKYPLALYAYSLTFYHPISKEVMTFSLHPKDGYFKDWQEEILKI